MSDICKYLWLDLFPFQLLVVLVLILPSGAVGLDVNKEDNNILLATFLKAGGKLLDMAGHLGR